MDEFYGVFNGDDMVLTLSVRLIYDGSECSRFPATGGPSHQHQPPGQGGEFGHHRREAQLLHCLNFTGNLTEHRANPKVLLKIVRAVAGQSRYLVSKINVPGLLEGLNLLFRGNFVKHALEFIVLQHFVFNPFHVSLNPERWLLPSHQV